MITLVVVLLVSYLVGAIPWSFIAGKLVGGIDLRTVGSGNLGATNTFRALGARVAVPVLVLDIAKGLVAPLVFARLRVDAPAVSQPALAALAGLAAIVGHIFPVYMGFRGGKGIATSAGAFVAIEPRAFLVCAACFFLAFFVSRGIVSVGSLAGSLALPFAVYGFGMTRGDLQWSHLAIAIALATLIWLKHLSNLRRLAHGHEKSLFDRSSRLARR